MLKLVTQPASKLKQSDSTLQALKHVDTAHLPPTLLKKKKENTEVHRQGVNSAVLG